jgi:tetratricopeptide (TPR) repeat protein
MQYAISRRNEYDVQAKITWMVDSLLSTAPAKVKSNVAPQAAEGDNVDYLLQLRRHLSGDDIKTSHRKKLKPLFESCREVLRLEEHVLNLKQRLADESLEVVIPETQALMAEVLEDSGIDLAPLKRELVDVAHRFSSRILVRSEMALAIMKRMKGDAIGSHQHLANALFQATHVDDDPIEARILARLSVLALSTKKHEKAVRLSSAAIGLEALNESMNLKQHVVLSMAQFLNGEDYDGTISKVQTMVQADHAVAMQALTELGESFLALNRPDFAIELFDEAMECSSTDGNIDEHLGELVLLAHRAMEDDDDVEVEGLRRVLDRIHEQTTQQQKAVEKTVEDISKRQESERHVEVSTDWQSSEVLLDDERPLYITALVGEAAEEQLIVAQHPSLGTIGIWMPSSIQAPQPGAKITLSNSRVKVAQAPEKLAEAHSLKALIAIENPEGLVFQSLTEDAKEELEEL